MVWCRVLVGAGRPRRGRVSDWLDTEDGRAAVEAGKAHRMVGAGCACGWRRPFVDGVPDVPAAYERHHLGVLLALTSPCPTCGGSGAVYTGHLTRWRLPRSVLPYRLCRDCHGSGTVPLLVPREEG